MAIDASRAVGITPDGGHSLGPKHRTPRAAMTDDKQNFVFLGCSGGFPNSAHDAPSGGVRRPLNGSFKLPRPTRPQPALGM
jgi:hypothetical protein